MLCIIFVKFQQAEKYLDDYKQSITAKTEQIYFLKNETD